jgi:hypothetical protein
MNIRKNVLLFISAISLIFQVSCAGKNTLQVTGKITSVFHIIGALGMAVAIFLWFFKDKIRDFIKGKKNIKFLVSGFSLLLLCEGEIFAQGIDFLPAVDTFLTILLQFSSITAGACGFYGLTRVAWLLVNEERSSGTALVMSIIGFVVATIAVGLLTR